MTELHTPRRARPPTRGAPTRALTPVLLTALAIGCGSSAPSVPSGQGMGFDLPTAISLGGTVFTSPRVQPIYFAGFPHTAKLELFFQRLETSTYWPTVVGEYGVGAPTILPGYTTQAAAPSPVTETQLPAVLSQVLTEGSATLGAARSDTIYTLFFDPATVLTVSGLTLCDANEPFGYHTELTIGSTKVAVAVIPTCATSPIDPALTGADVITPTVSHEVVEAATDPFPQTAPAFGYVDDAHVIWMAAFDGGEIADLCENETPNLVVPDDLGFPVQRIWSNASAAAGAGPCVPVPAGESYFNAIARLPDQVRLQVPGGQVLTVPGLKAKAGASVTAQVTFNGTPGGPRTWRAAAIELDTATGAINAHPVSVTGNAGQTLPVTVAPSSATGGTGVLPLVVAASDGVSLHFWVGTILRN